ncbi:peptidylprolyl isomerase [Leucothrix pacifica]|uniref:peptidylprolyl isomerase n=1 Tax=Leucothrix pacifica TaxID=1247513 RepID=A0A317C8W3_9GAMM|nr:peptidylprolyl isomerase [Leucothrix pacifica]PWQ95034.1 peptidylprolyl isomerase [Leucothrix pacifica]
MIIRKTLLVAGISLSLGLSQAVLADSHAEAAPKATESVVAVVNGKEITQDSLNKYLSVVQRSADPKKSDPRAALDDLVATELALQEAAKTDILSREDVKQRIEDFTRNVLLTTWTKEKVEGFEVTDEDLQKTYDERVKKDADDEFKARHILLKTEEEANAVIKEVADGGKFEDVAKAKSTGPSASNGGDLGWFKSSTMVKPFADAVKEMEKGGVSKAPVKTQFGWHVIKLEDTRPAKLPALDTMKPQLKRMMAQQMMMDFMEKMKESADIKIMLADEKAPAEKAEATAAPEKAE